METQTVQKEVLDHIRENKEFDTIRWDKQNVTVLSRIRIRWSWTVNIVIEGTSRDSSQHMTRHAVVAARPTTWRRQYVDWWRYSSQITGYQRVKSVHEDQQDEEPYPQEWEQNDRSFDSVNIKYHNFDNVKSVIFTKLESSTSQKRVHIKCKIDIRSNGNLVPFKIFRILFP